MGWIYFEKVLVAKKYKPYEIYKRMCDVYGEVCFNQRIFTNELNKGLLL